MGKPDVKPDKPSHMKGIRQGNETGSYENMAGHLSSGKSTAERSTGINPASRNPIDPGSPNLSPA